MVRRRRKSRSRRKRRRRRKEEEEEEEEEEEKRRRIRRGKKNHKVSRNQQTVDRIKRNVFVSFPTLLLSTSDRHSLATHFAQCTLPLVTIINSVSPSA
ncbi:hypothetical protein ElyMa_000471600 [Elysia marginata]|uniref:Uncharacterized protein n=1 Tax=Elysia marginata TaxID=1093978 RepID=A0AAV4FSU4_9GAST|nr:hypothetical protein ElyMa_000471600 [Elysia marginata]